MPADPVPGGCLCGAVAFALVPPLDGVILCHCADCRRSSGHVWAHTTVPMDRFRLRRDAGLRWFAGAPGGERGFCGLCGASLFRRGPGAGLIEVAAGALEAPTGLGGVIAHRHPGQAGDYYAPMGPPPPPPAAPAPARLTARCLCGGAAFALPGPAGAITACHCTQCRRLSGHYSASFDADAAQVRWICRDRLAEYATPGGGRRGFCARCGSSLWFRAADGALSVEAGAIEGPTGGRLAAHIFTADRGDYYAIDDGLPQAPGW